MSELNETDWDRLRQYARTRERGGEVEKKRTKKKIQFIIIINCPCFKIIFLNNIHQNG